MAKKSEATAQFNELKKVSSKLNSDKDRLGILSERLDAIIVDLKAAGYGKEKRRSETTEYLKKVEEIQKSFPKNEDSEKEKSETVKKLQALWNASKKFEGTLKKQSKKGRKFFGHISKFANDEATESLSNFVGFLQMAIMIIKAT